MTEVVPVGENPDPGIGVKIKNQIVTRIKPALTPGEGDIIYRGFKDGIVFVEFIGSGSRLKAGMEKVLCRDFSEVKGVANYGVDKPVLGLDTETGKAVLKIIDEVINPQVASHGGRIALVDVLGDTVYVRMEGGCQGCRMATATLKQSIVKEIQKQIPAIGKVLDVTDHASGANPYYQPKKTRKKWFFSKP